MENNAPSNSNNGCKWPGIASYSLLMLSRVNPNPQCKYYGVVFWSQTYSYTCTFRWSISCTIIIHSVLYCFRWYGGIIGLLYTFIYLLTLYFLSHFSGKGKTCFQRHHREREKARFGNRKRMLVNFGEYINEELRWRRKFDRKATYNTCQFPYFLLSKRNWVQCSFVSFLYVCLFVVVCCCYCCCRG